MHGNAMLSFLREDDKTIFQFHAPSVIFQLSANKKLYRTFQIKLLGGKSDRICILFQ